MSQPAVHLPTCYNLSTYMLHPPPTSLPTCYNLPIYSYNLPTYMPQPPSLPTTTLEG